MDHHWQHQHQGVGVKRKFGGGGSKNAREACKNCHFYAELFKCCQICSTHLKLLAGARERGETTSGEMPPGSTTMDHLCETNFVDCIPKVLFVMTNVQIR